MEKGKILVDQALANRADVYLRMWTALESFNPNADRWAEPTDFGSQSERIESAENAIAVMESRYRDRVDETALEDVVRFRETVTRLISGEIKFSGSVAEFCERLRRRGVETSYASLKHVGSVGSTG